MGLGAGQKLRGVHEDGMRRLMRLLRNSVWIMWWLVITFSSKSLPFWPNIMVVGRPGRRSKPGHHLACNLRLYSKLVSEC